MGSCFSLSTPANVPTDDSSSRLVAGWPAGLLSVTRPSCCGQIWVYCVFGGIWKSSKLWLKITAVCHDMLMSDLGTLLCRTEAKLHKLINETNEAMFWWRAFVWRKEAGLQQIGASHQQQMRCRFTLFGQIKIQGHVGTLARSSLGTQELVDYNQKKKTYLS